MKRPALILFGGIFFAGMIPISPWSENYWMIAIGLVGFVASWLFVPEDF